MELLQYFFKAYPRRTLIVFFTVTIASVITAITLLALPALLAGMLGRSTGKAELFNQFFIQAGLEPTTETLMLFLILGIIIQNILLGAAKLYAGFTKAKIIKDLRIKLIKAIAETEWSYFRKQSSGNITSSLINETNGAGDGYETIVTILSISVQIIAYLFVSFLISWEIAVIAVITSFILSLLFGKLIAKSREYGTEDISLLRKITSQLTDLYRSIKPLKAMARESHSHAILNSYSKEIKSVSKKNTTVSELLDMLQEIILMVTIIVTIYISFQHLNLPIEYSLILVILFLRSMKLFGKSQKEYQTFVANEVAFKMVIDAINEAKDNRESRKGTKQHLINGDIRFSEVSFKYGDRVILANASMTFYHNKLNSIVGITGVGKTTLADLICGLYKPTSGEIYIDNIPLSDINIEFWRSQIGYVVQETNLLNATIKDNITLGDNKFTNQDIDVALKKAHAYEFVGQLPEGIDTVVGENGSRLSGGQRQRILIARGLVHSPRLLILDEATSALDSETEEQLSILFRELSKNITIISISHRPAIRERSHHVVELSHQLPDLISRPTITSPENDTVLLSDTITVSWNPKDIIPTNWSVGIGNEGPGSYNLASSGVLSPDRNSATISGLASDGKQITVSLFTCINGFWSPVDTIDITAYKN